MTPLWVTLRLFPRVHFLSPFANPHEDWKDKFVLIREWDNTSHVIARAGGVPLFPLSRTHYPKLTARVDSRVLSPSDCEAIQVLECFCLLESTTLIDRDHEDGDKGKYFSFMYCCMDIL